MKPHKAMPSRTHNGLLHCRMLANWTVMQQPCINEVGIFGFVMTDVT
jgi:hypothetical protein